MKDLEYNFYWMRAVSGEEENKQEEKQEEKKEDKQEEKQEDKKDEKKIFKTFEDEVSYKKELEKAKEESINNLLKTLGVDQSKLTEIVNNAKELEEKNKTELQKANDKIESLSKAAKEAIDKTNVTMAVNESLKLGVDPNQVNYLVKLLDFSTISEENGFVNTEKLVEEIGTILKNVPAFGKQIVPPVQQGGRDNKDQDKGGDETLSLEKIKSMSTKEMLAFGMDKINAFLSKQK